MSIKDTDVPYVAMWAMLLAVRQHNKISQQQIGSVVWSWYRHWSSALR
jgi:hypothetical protein